MPLSIERMILAWTKYLLDVSSYNIGNGIGLTDATKKHSISFCGEPKHLLWIVNIGINCIQSVSQVYVYTTSAISMQFRGQ